MTTAIHKLVVGVTALGLAVMLGITVVQRLQNPSLVRHVQPPQPVLQAAAEESPLARLMREAGEQPDNASVQLELAKLLLYEGRTEQAEVFLDKAQVLDMNNAEVPYLKGYIATVRKDYARAAELMEESLRLQDRVDVRISVGMLYQYYVKDSAKALAHWNKALENPAITPRERTQILTETDKLKKAAQ